MYMYNIYKQFYETDQMAYVILYISVFKGFLLIWNVSLSAIFFVYENGADYILARFCLRNLAPA